MHSIIGQIEERVTGVNFDDFVGFVTALNPCGRELETLPATDYQADDIVKENAERSSCGEKERKALAAVTENKVSEPAATNILDNLESNCRPSKRLLEEKNLKLLSTPELDQIDVLIEQMRAATYDGTFHQNYRLFSDAEIVVIVCALYLGGDDYMRQAFRIFDANQRCLIAAEDLICALPLMRCIPITAVMVGHIRDALKDEPVDYPVFVAVLQYISHKDFGRIDIAVVKRHAMLGIDGIDSRTEEAVTQAEAKQREE